MSKDQIADTTKKLIEIDQTIKQLDPSIRSAAFDLLAPLYFETAKAQRNIGNGRQEASSKTTPTNYEDKETFYTSFEHSKPSENVLLIVAWFYSQYGKFPITRTDIENEGAEAGLTVPTRPDTTMKQAKHKGKALFIKKGKGFELTITGETRIKEVYKVRKGNKQRPESD